MLRKLGHVTKEGVVTLKGRAACEISTGDELLTTELMFNGVFNSLDKHQLVSLISCLVPVEKSNVSIASSPSPCNSLRVTSIHALVPRSLRVQGRITQSNCALAMKTISCV